MRRGLWISLILLLLSACSSLPPPAVPVVISKPVPPVAAPTQPSEQTNEQPGPTVTPAIPLEVPESPITPAPATPTSTLLASVDSALANGDLTLASALCERALRISPRDALLWYRLADIRLRQERWQEADANARRGLVSVGANIRLKAQLNAVLQRAAAALGTKPN